MNRELHTCYKYSSIYTGLKGKYHKGQRVNFLYVSKEFGTVYFEENVEITNSSWEDPILRTDHELVDNRIRTKTPISYYFLNDSGRIMSAWITEDNVYPLNIKTPGLLYDKT